MNRNNKKTRCQTADTIYRRSAVTIGNFRGIPSVAARHTAIEYLDYGETIQLDAGHVPREIGFKKLLVLITHFHADHGSDISNCIHNNLNDGFNNDRRITIFVPAYCAKKVFKKIKLDISLQKGRKYTDEEITKIVRIIGCKKHSDNSDMNKIMSKKSEGVVIAEMINMGDQILVKLRNNDEVMIEPFECYHTVDTCGYVIHDVKKRLSDIVKIEPNTFIDNNFTEDQKNNNDNINHDDINKFSHGHNVKINVEIIKTPKTRNFVLNTRRLIFPDGLNITPKDEDDIIFFKKYKIDHLTNQLKPKVMFFGDTCSYVFNYQSPGYTRVCELLDTVENVIIESTYIDMGKNMMNDIKFKKRQDKRHMFLFELVKIFKKYRKTRFILIHFSACYTHDDIIKNIDNVKNQIKNNNIKAFI